MKRQVSPTAVPEKKRRAYYGPPKGSEAAKLQMEQVRAAQWARNGLQTRDCNFAPPESYGPGQR